MIYTHVHNSFCTSTHAFFQKEINIILKKNCMYHVHRKHGEKHFLHSRPDWKYFSSNGNVCFSREGTRGNEETTLEKSLFLCRHI